MAISKYGRQKKNWSNSIHTKFIPQNLMNWDVIGHW